MVFTDRTMKMLVLLFVLVLFWGSTECTNIPHPLDPLTPSEIKLVQTIYSPKIIPNNLKHRSQQPHLPIRRIGRARQDRNPIMAILKQPKKDQTQNYPSTTSPSLRHSEVPKTVPGNHRRFFNPLNNLNQSLPRAWLFYAHLWRTNCCVTVTVRLWAV